MLVYLALIIYLIIMSKIVLGRKVRTTTIKGIGKPKKLNDNAVCCLLIVVPLIVFFGIRDFSVGTDTSYVYQDLYYTGYAIEGWKFGIYEGLFKILVILSHYIVPSYRFFLFFMGTIICVSFSVYFVKQRQNLNAAIALVSFFTWLYLPSYNILRQILAISICFYGTLMLEKKRPILAIIIYSTACFIHIASLIMIFYVILYLFRKKANARRVLPILFFFMPIVVVLVFSLIVKLSFFSKFQQYINTFSISNINYKFFFFQIAVLPLFAICWSKLIKLSKFNYIHLCATIFIYSLILLSGFFVFAFRMMYFCFPSEIILLSQISKCFKDKYIKSLVNIYILLVSIASFFLIYIINGTDGVYPYMIGV